MDEKIKKIVADAHGGDYNVVETKDFIDGVKYALQWMEKNSSRKYKKNESLPVTILRNARKNITNKEDIKEINHILALIKGMDDGSIIAIRQLGYCF